MSFLTMNIYQKIGKRVKTLRKLTGLSQGELASMLGYKNCATLCYKETAKRKFSIYDLILICKLFNLKITTMIE